MTVPNLNKQLIETDGPEGRPFEDHGCRGHMVEVCLRNLTDRLVREIAISRVVVGCVAWLTSKRILDALARCPGGVGIVVQKEDFLRPDTAPGKGWAEDLRRRYDALKSPPNRYSHWPSPLYCLSAGGDPRIAPVRCVGNHNRDKSPAFPRMHHKFVVFCDDIVGTEEEDEFDEIVPRAVWTGSFNFTENSSRSLENAVIITEPNIVQAYFNEWAQVEAISEPLDWSDQWCAPEWRIGS